MSKVEIFKKKAERFIREKNVLAKAFLLAGGVLVAQVTPAFADISGDTIKNNLITNYFQPFYIIVMVFLLLKEFFRKSYGSLFVTLVIGGIIGIFIFAPEAINIIISTVKGIFGM